MGILREMNINVDNDGAPGGKVGVPAAPAAPSYTYNYSQPAEQHARAQPSAANQAQDPAFA